MNSFKISWSKITIIISLLGLVVLFSCNQKSTKKKIDLNDNWEFYYAKTDKWYPATVPGSIHTDLFANELIDDPFYSTNADSLVWISNETWKYRKEFSIQKLFYNRNLEIVFDGLDTHAEIFLNEKKIGETSNMYRQWVFPIDDSIKKEKNTLEVIFHPSSEYNAEKLSDDNYAIPDNRVFSRKAPFQYGWDWAPNLETCGIYKDVYINSWEKLRIKHINFEQKRITDTLATIIAKIELESENFYNGDVKIFSPNHEFDTLYQKLDIEEGINIYEIEFGIQDPELWWCNGLGNAKTYDITVQVSTKFRVEEKHLKIGVRDIELATNSDDYGQEFYFIINDIPVFARGANWVPAMYFSGSNTYENYLDLLQMAKDANFNMLRVWGGGIYENDEFYTICDSLGIMVWQDFMFSCAMYPLDEEMTNNIVKEVNYQVNRLNNHPSVVMWCGNNEISNAWFDWGWQDQYNISAEDSLQIWEDYDNLFHRIIPKTINKIDKSRKYISSSPFYGWGHDESLTSGDSHYWGVWWGMEDFNTYYSKTGRFMSEYGFQGMPSLKTMKKFIPEDSIFLYSNELKSHQKHPFGFEAISKYMEREYPIPDSIKDYIYVSQILQAEGLQKAFDAHLSSMPYCMGSLFWQFNDCWPVVSWSAVDFYKQPKALYYYAKRSFANIHASPMFIENEFKMYITNQNNKTINSKIVLKIMDFEGEIIHADSINAIVDLLTSTEIKFYHTPDTIISNNKNNTFSLLEMSDFENDEIYYSKSFTFGKNKNLQLPENDFSYNAIRKKKAWEITIKNEFYVKDLHIQSKNSEGKFSDNFFNLLPNETKVVYFYPNDIEKDLKLEFNSMNSIIHEAFFSDEVVENDATE